MRTHPDYMGSQYTPRTMGPQRLRPVDLITKVSLSETDTATIVAVFRVSERLGHVKRTRAGLNQQAARLDGLARQIYTFGFPGPPLLTQAGFFLFPSSRERYG